MQLYMQKLYWFFICRAFINEKYVVASDVAVGDILDCRVGKKHIKVGHLNVLAPYVKSDQRKEIDRKVDAGEHVQVKARVSEMKINMLH